MNLPVCPNHKQSASICERSALRLLGENDHSWIFTCSTCHLLWSISKPKTKDRAKYENQMRRVQRASEVERERASRRVYSLPKL